MSILRPPSDKIPGEQSSKTPSGKKVPMAMSMMVDSMVRMIQGAKQKQSGLGNKESRDLIDEN